MADETQVPRLMEEALDRALDIGRGLCANRRLRPAAVCRASRAEAARRPREHDRPPARRRRCDRSRARGRAARPDRRARVRRRVRAASRRLHRPDRRRRGISRERSDPSPAMGDLLGRHAADCQRHGAGAGPRARGARPHREPFPQQGQAAPTAVRRVFRQGLPNRGCVEDSPARRARRRRRGRERAERVPARSECGAVAGRAARLSDRASASTARRSMLTACSIFPRRSPRRSSLLAQMDEFARSRYRLEGRYHHVLLDEFQDTSRAQWTLVALLIRSWGEGSGIAEGAPLIPSIFLVGDRKQSIYGFRDADVAVMDEAGAFVDELRADRDSRRAISKSFRAVPQLLAFANDVFARDRKGRAAPGCLPFRRDRTGFRSTCRLRLATRSALSRRRASPITPTPWRPRFAACSTRRRSSATPTTRELRPISPRDIGILFRTKDSHQDFEKALERQRIPSYVYKGLGFFEADEIKDVLALLRYLAAPESNLRAAALLRSRFVRLSDPALQALAPNLASALSGRKRRSRRARSRGSPRARARAAEHRALARARRSAAAGRGARAGARRNRLCVRDAGSARAPGERKPEEDPRDDSPRPEPRLRDDVAAGRTPRAPDGRRRVERRHRRRRFGQPDDDSRGEGARISGRLRREPQPRNRRPPPRHSRRLGCRARRRPGSVSAIFSRKPTPTRRRRTAKRRSACCMWR